MQNVLQIWMIPHIYILFEFISIPYENQHQTLNIKKIDRGQIKFREYSITLLQPSQARCQCSRHNQKNVIGRNLFVSFMGVARDENGGRGLQQQQGRGRRVWGRRNIFRHAKKTLPFLIDRTAMFQISRSLWGLLIMCQILRDRYGNISYLLRYDEMVNWRFQSLFLRMEY